MTELEMRYKEYLGPETGLDMFGLPIFLDSTAYLIYNVGDTRESLLQFLQEAEIKVIEEKGPFKSVVVYLPNPNAQIVQINTYDSKLDIVQMI